MPETSFVGGMSRGAGAGGMSSGLRRPAAPDSEKWPVRLLRRLPLPMREELRNATFNDSPVLHPDEQRAIFRSVEEWLLHYPDENLDLTGRRFGKLAVVRFSHYLEHGEKNPVHYDRWIVRCDCGKVGEKEVGGNHLRTGNTTSCGCKRGRPRGSKNKK